MPADHPESRAAHGRWRTGWPDPAAAAATNRYRLTMPWRENVSGGGSAVGRPCRASPTGTACTAPSTIGAVWRHAEAHTPSNLFKVVASVATVEAQSACVG